MQVPLSKPSITQREIDLITEVLKSGTLSLGAKLPEFEEKFADFVGSRFAVAVNSGTSALHLCVRALDIGPQDEVITTSFSFVASANCVLYEGALPVFVDIASDTLNVDPAQIVRFLRERCERVAGSRFPKDRLTGRWVKAILPVHVFGLPCDMHRIRAIASEYGLYIVEDACEALGAQYHGAPVGTFGDCGVFAFYPNKQMTTGEGGMIVTDDPQIADACRSMRNQGRNASCSWLEHSRLGYNYRLSELHCALGIAQLERAEELLAARAKVAAIYQEQLADQTFLKLPFTPADRTRSWFVYIVQLIHPDPAGMRDQMIEELRACGVGCQAYFPAIHQQPYFHKCVPRNVALPLPQTERAAGACIALPFFAEASREHVEYVCSALLDVVEQYLGKEKALLSA